MANLYLDICLSDIPKERIKTAANGKKYLKAIIRPRKQTDRDGYDHYIAAFVPKEERTDGPCFIGRAQLKEYDNQPSQAETEKAVISAKLAQQPARNINIDNDLPF